MSIDGGNDCDGDFIASTTDPMRLPDSSLTCPTRELSRRPSFPPACQGEAACIRTRELHEASRCHE